MGSAKIYCSVAECNKSFKKESSLRMHMKLVHNQPNVGEKDAYASVKASTHHNPHLVDKRRGARGAGGTGRDQALQHQETHTDVSQTVKFSKPDPSNDIIITEETPLQYHDSASPESISTPKKHKMDISSDEPSDLPATPIHPHIRTQSSTCTLPSSPQDSPLSLQRQSRWTKANSQGSSTADNTPQHSPTQIKVPVSLSQPIPKRRNTSQLNPQLPRSQPLRSGDLSRSAKRPRIDRPPESSPVRVKASASRHPQFWHLDGSVVIQIENTIFRLHRSRLAQQSTYFADLFARAPAEPHAMEFGDVGVVDRCPVYKVTGVAVDDFAALLTALDSGIKFAMKPPPFPVLASILRAAHALEFEVMTEYTTFRLREMWPRDLSRLSSVRTAYPSETILLAQECDVPEVLKRAYYELLRTPVFGQASGNDADATPDARDSLSTADLVRLIATREKLLREWVQVTRAPPAPSAVPCPLEHIHANGMLNPELKLTLLQCREARAADNGRWVMEVARGAIFDEYMYDPLLGLDHLADMDWSEMGHCVGCVNARREMWIEKKEKLWVRMDEWLRLPRGVGRE